MYAELISLSKLVLSPPKQNIIAIHQGETITHARFVDDVMAMVAALKSLNQNDFALYYEQAYPFAVAFFALLHSGKTVWIAANHNAETAEYLKTQGCCLLGDWEGKEQTILPLVADVEPLQAIDMNKALLVIFTSGSSGQPKAIYKTLQQLQNELEVLEQLWGEQIMQSQIVATVSHQHIYGLLFRLLWPLSAGRCFHSQMYLSPEPLLNAVAESSACWIASPAQLKRLDELTPWRQISALSAIFSSGGELPEQASRQILLRGKQQVLEVFGSSETGGIAWRQAIEDEWWTVFSGISLRQNAQGESLLNSAYLPDQTAYQLDDRIELDQKGKFKLLGRRDRIVKIEEKRLSLDQLEHSLNQSDWVQQSYTLLLAGKREKIATVLVLSETGEQLLQQQGRKALVKVLRKQLMSTFETVVLPKKWLIMSSLPLNSQGKIDRSILEQLFSLDSHRFPYIQACNLADNSLELQIKIPAGLVYFAGHFPGQPILPGVTQLAWVETFGKIFFNISNPFSHMEVVKFKKIIRPDDLITMTLIWKPETGKLYFELRSTEDLHGSGRLVYGEQG